MQDVSPSPVPTAAPSSASVFDPATAHWARIGAVPAASGGISNLVGFDGGYVALGSAGDLEEPMVSWSDDGQTWAATSLANSVKNCPGWGPPGDEMVPDADAGAVAANGHAVVIVGSYQPHTPASCAATSFYPVAWVSEDGRTWSRSEPFSTSGASGRATAVWAIAGGWEAIAEDPGSGINAIWRSADGLHWQVATDAAELDSTPVYAASGEDGTVVMTRSAGDVGNEVVRLFRSSAGESWTAIDAAGGCGSGVTQIVAPAGPGLAAWSVVGDRKVCTSKDLVHWSSKALPMSVWRIAGTRFGVIAIGDTCSGAGVDCPDPGPRACITTDGVAWSSLAHPKVYYGRTLADGPAGVLLLGTGPDDGDTPASAVWRLES
jgi:hypothetical protein